MQGIDVSYCESVWANSNAPWHVRILSPGEAKIFRGGLTLQALCGKEVAWDVDIAVTLEAALLATYTCEGCRAVLREVERRARLELSARSR